MPRITPGNRLYLYKLLSHEIGVGKQTMISRVEEVLYADDIMPCDLACESTRELLEQLDDFVRLTVFKKGRVYATVLSREDWDALLTQAETDTKGTDAPGAKGGPRSWKRKKAAKALRPAKPRPRNRPVEVEEAVAEKELVEEAPVAESPITKESTEETPATTSATEAPVEPKQRPESQQQPEPVPETQPDPEPEPVSEPVPEPEAQPAPESSPQPAPAVILPDPWPDLPHDIAAEVRVDSPTLAALYRILPLDVDPLALVAADWRVARSTNSCEGNRCGVEFCLRSLVSKDTPVRLELKRISPTTQGQRWELLLKTSEDDLAGASLEGLPHANEGIWRDLDIAYDDLRAYELVNPERSLAQFAVLGPWPDLLSDLAKLAEPESWGSDLVCLREYLSITFVRIQREDKIVLWANGTRAAFDTGLLTFDAKRILMMFCACEGDIAWRFDSFCTTDAIPAAASHQPEPATYVESLASITLAPPYDVQIPKMLERTYGPYLRDAVHRSCVRARRNYRVATPAYDPHADALRLLLPLDLKADGATSHALVLAPTAQGYVARAVVTLPHARACARVVSSELPTWLLRG